MLTHHETSYLEKGDAEIVCGQRQTWGHVLSTYSVQRANARRVSRILSRESAKDFTALLRIAVVLHARINIDHHQLRPLG